jgi:hypothetical protein
MLGVGSRVMECAWLPISTWRVSGTGGEDSFNSNRASAAWYLRESKPEEAWDIFTRVVAA